MSPSKSTSRAYLVHRCFFHRTVDLVHDALFEFNFSAASLNVLNPVTVSCHFSFCQIISDEDQLEAMSEVPGNLIFCTWHHFEKLAFTHSC